MNLNNDTCRMWTDCSLWIIILLGKMRFNWFYIWFVHYYGSFHTPGQWHCDTDCDNSFYDAWWQNIVDKPVKICRFTLDIFHWWINIHVHSELSFYYWCYMLLFSLCTKVSDLRLLLSLSPSEIYWGTLVNLADDPRPLHCQNMTGHNGSDPKYILHSWE